MTGKNATTDRTQQLSAPSQNEPHDTQAASDTEQRELWTRYLEQRKYAQFRPARENHWR